MNKIVKFVTDEEMDGDNELEKKINAYLTSHVVSVGEIPSNECLHEAKEVIKIFQEYYNDNATMT